MMALESLLCCGAVHGVLKPRSYYAEILVFQFASFPGDILVRHKQLQCCLPLCFIAGCITPVQGFDLCSASLFFVSLCCLGLMPKDNPSCSSSAGHTSGGYLEPFLSILKHQGPYLPNLSES